MTKEIAKKIAKGIEDKIECNTVDIDDWAEFWGFTREEYEKFLDMAVKALEQESKVGHWVYSKMVSTGEIRWSECSNCGNGESGCARRMKYCPNCGARMER